MRYENIEVRVEGGKVGIITLNRPKALNALNGPLMDELGAALKAFDADENIGCMIITGSEKAFAAGADIAAMAKYNFHEVYKQDFITRNWETIRSIRKPVIAAVSGAAVAGGMELALWCDMRVMEEDAYFGIYCRRFGVPLIDGGTVRLPRLIGMGHAMDLILTGRRVDAAEALQMGLCNRVVPRGGARGAAIALARQLADFPQATMLADRMNAYAQADLALLPALHQEWERGRQCLGDALDGAARFAAGDGRNGRF